ncbi:hypothetical protein Bca52824_052090 [Brassica carinata]|uniref:Uncharacterized protein n=1 Tax=Brassica carinata TaxID=52824 RepID=A0A8X7R5N0_BRACI|nr:hypothetical protein Bca52824_052090 [Brassica carinata]
MREIVSSCVDGIEDDTVQGQTGLHLAVLPQEIGAVWEKGSHKDLVKYFTFKKYRDSPSEARSALLVATATFHASLTPPGVPWQESHMPDVSMNRTSTNTPNQQQKRRP